MSLEYYRKLCLTQQTELRSIMLSVNHHDQAIQLFLTQHAMLHSEKMAEAGHWSFEDEILDRMPEAQMRRVPLGCEHSVAWLIWHIARCEDITIWVSTSKSPGLRS